MAAPADDSFVYFVPADTVRLIVALQSFSKSHVDLLNSTTLQTSASKDDPLVVARGDTGIREVDFERDIIDKSRLGSEIIRVKGVQKEKTCSDTFPSDFKNAVTDASGKLKEEAGCGILVHFVPGAIANFRLVDPISERMFYHTHVDCNSRAVLFGEPHMALTCEADPLSWILQPSKEDTDITFQVSKTEPIVSIGRNCIETGTTTKNILDVVGESKGDEVSLSGSSFHWVHPNSILQLAHVLMDGSKGFSGEQTPVQFQLTEDIVRVVIRNVRMVKPTRKRSRACVDTILTELQPEACTVSVYNELIH